MNNYISCFYSCGSGFGVVTTLLSVRSWKEMMNERDWPHYADHELIVCFTLKAVLIVCDGDDVMSEICIIFGKKLKEMSASCPRLLSWW